ncbi:MAG: hypothetical protein M1830_005685 [Pleopsidium flavum]|nr:MAG: hypothetical protein M1830_005685 [Pleopsidium flavum]
MCIIEHVVDVYPDGAKNVRKVLIPCREGDGRSPCSNTRHRNTGERFLRLPDAPDVPTVPQPFQPAVGNAPGVQLITPNQTRTQVPKAQQTKPRRMRKDLKLVVDIHIPFTGRGKQKAKHRRPDIILVEPRLPERQPHPAPPPPPAPAPPAPLPPLEGERTAFAPNPRPWPVDPGTPRPPPPPIGVEPVPPQRPSTPIVIHHYRNPNRRPHIHPIREHSRRRPISPPPRRRDDAHLEINRERDRRHQAEAERNHAEGERRRAEAIARTALADRMRAEAEAEGARIQRDVARDRANREREFRNQECLEQIEAERIQRDRRRRVELERRQLGELEAERIERERRLRVGPRPWVPVHVHQNRSERLRERGERVIGEAIQDAEWRDAERRALDDGVFRRVRAEDGLRRRDTIGARERVVYENEYTRQGFRWL